MPKKEKKLYVKFLLLKKWRKKYKKKILTYFMYNDLIQYLISFSLPKQPVTPLIQVPDDKSGLRSAAASPSLWIVH